MATRPPRRGARDAPVFDGSDPKTLPRFIKDVEMIAANAQWDDETKMRYVRYYASVEVAKLWEALPAFGAANKVWDDAKKQIQELYPTMTKGKQYSRGELEQLVVTWAEKGIRTRDELGQYRREFTVRANYLVTEDKITKKESMHTFLRGITGDLRAMLLRRLEVKYPDHKDGDPYEIETTVKEADFILGGASFTSQSGNATLATLATASATIGGTATVPKKEEVNLASVMETLKEFQAQLDTLSKGGGVSRYAQAGSSYQGTASANRPPCAFCGENGHYIRSCAKVREYIQAGKCVRNAEGRVVLPNGSYITGALPGRNLMERLDGIGKESNQPVNLFGIAPSETGPESRVEATTAAILEEGDEDKLMEIERLECMLNDAKKKAANAKRQKFDGVEIQAKMKGSQAKAPAAQASGTSQNAQLRNDITKAAEDRGQYRYMSAIESPEIAHDVLNRSLDQKVTVSQRELLALSPEVRRLYKEMIATKRVQVNETHLHDSLLTQCSQCDGTEGYSFVENGTPSAREALPLRTVRALVEGLVEVDCILDQGASVNIMREDVWKQLQIPLEPRKCLRLETANTGIAATLGLVENTMFGIAGINIGLPVQVVRDTPFQALLGRPFFVVTECETKDFATGDQHITLTDPGDRS